MCNLQGIQFDHLGRLESSQRTWAPSWRTCAFPGAKLLALQKSSLSSPSPHSTNAATRLGSLFTSQVQNSVTGQFSTVQYCTAEGKNLVQLNKKMPDVVGSPLASIEHNSWSACAVMITICCVYSLQRSREIVEEVYRCDMSLPLNSMHMEPPSTSTGLKCKTTDEHSLLYCTVL